MRVTLADRLDAYSVPNERGCLVWQRSTRSGYGQVYGATNAHRGAYELMYGPIPEGLTIDHICRNRRCVNPLHLEAVTARENTRRGWAARRPQRLVRLPMPNPDDLISASEAADLLGISLPTLHRLARRKRIRTALKGDGIRGARWFRCSDVIAYRDHPNEEKAA